MSEVKCDRGPTKEQPKRGPGRPRKEDSERSRKEQLAGALKVLEDRFAVSSKEVLSIITSSRSKPSRRTTSVSGFTNELRLLVMSDSHIGSNKFREDLFNRLVLDSKEVDVVLHVGDHLEGMSGRPGHVYELSEIGFKAQSNRAIGLYSQIDKPMYGIDGNHDQWFKQKGDSGIVVGEWLESKLPNYTHLGEWEGNLCFDGLKVKLFHANDGTAYANSYKLQKLVESLSGEDKPHLLFSGHYHKALYQFTRNIHAWEGGTLCGQTIFMRGKKLAAHMGYWLISVKHRKGSVDRVTSTFVAGY